MVVLIPSGLILALVQHLPGVVTLCPLGPLGSSSSQHRRTPEIVLKKDHDSFRITSDPPVQSIAVCQKNVARCCRLI